MSKYNRISIIISSTHTEKEKEKFLDEVEKTSGCDTDILFIENHGQALTKVYQEALETEDNDIIVFMHDDIHFIKPNWGSEILRMFEEHEDYGIIGVAGSRYFDSVGAWWTYKDIYGIVYHVNPIHHTPFPTYFSNELKQDLVQVVVIDGLFIAVNKNKISKGFDTNIPDFHFYDIDFCLNNYLDRKCKIGVTTKISILHESLGELKPKWHANKELINKKYGKYYPIQLKLKDDE